MKTIVITGGNSGMGLEAVKLLAQDKNNELILGCHNIKKAETEIKKVKAISGNKKITIFSLDLDSFDSIRAFAKQVKETVTIFDILACNAGVQTLKHTETTKEGYELTFGVNVLGHFFLSSILFSSLNQSTGRIIITSSGTHFNPPIWQSRITGVPGGIYKGWKELSSPNGFSEYKGQSKGYVRYSSSKLCTLLFGYELDKKIRCTDSNVTVNMFDPGLMPGTGLAREASPVIQWMWKNVLPVMRVFNGIHSPKTSAKNLTALLVNPKFNNVTGKYFEEQKIKPSSLDSYNKNFQQDLWTGCEKLVGKQFTI